jgi:FkbM family methyltransferase
MYRPRHTYAQFGEDAILQSILGDGVGSYVDIGAGDPIRTSNTYALYRLGWRGVLVDPIASNVDRARRFRKGDRVVHAGCGREQGELVFFEYSTYEFSTTSRERVEELQSQGISPKATYSVPIFAMRDLALSGMPSDRSVLSIDVEGMEVDILKGNDWNTFRPRLIVIEEWVSPLKETTEVFQILKSEGYSLAAFTGVTSIYQFTG